MYVAPVSKMLYDVLKNDSEANEWNSQTIVIKYISYLIRGGFLNDSQFFSCKK